MMDSMKKAMAMMVTATPRSIRIYNYRSPGAFDGRYGDFYYEVSNECGIVEFGDFNRMLDVNEILDDHSWVVKLVLKSYLNDEDYAIMKSIVAERNLAYYNTTG